jgi:putative ubiquitin-RnfH superfamily antitoxin RatB of RatAB toxin-antitoxin module
MIRSPSGGSYVLECALRHLDLEDQQSLIQELAKLPDLGVVVDLATDRRSSFCVKMLFTQGTPAQRAIFAKALKGSTLELANDKCGAFVLEEAIKQLDSDTRAELVGELIRSPAAVRSLASDKYGTFIAEVSVLVSVIATCAQPVVGW